MTIENELDNHVLSPYGKDGAFMAWGSLKVDAGVEESSTPQPRHQKRLGGPGVYSRGRTFVANTVAFDFGCTSRTIDVELKFDRKKVCPPQFLLNCLLPHMGYRKSIHMGCGADLSTMPHIMPLNNERCIEVRYNKKVQLVNILTEL